MTENSLYAINQVRPCYITPEELEVSKATITLYTKHFRKELNATKFRIQLQCEKWHCGQLDDSRIYYTVAGITSDLFISPEHCRTLAKGASVNLKGTALARNRIPRLQLLKSLAIQPAPVGTNIKQKDGFLVIPLLTTCRKPLWNSRWKLEKCYLLWNWYYLVL